MTHSYGYRAKTRSKFSKPFRRHGRPAPATYLQEFRRGEPVTIVMDSSVQKGMAHHFYHGRTGRVFDVTPRSVGVAVKKVVRNREVLKHLHVRIEHVRKSRCQEDLKARVKKCQEVTAKAKAENRAVTEAEKNLYRRLPAGVKTSFIAIPSSPELVVDFAPQPFMEKY